MPTVDRPELPRLIVNGSGTRKYVFTYKNTWDKKLKRAIRGKGDTTSVGRLEPVEGGEEGYGEIFFNEAFIEKYPALEHLRVFRHKGGKLDFKPKAEEMNVIRPTEIRRLHAGATWALNQIVGNTPLATALHDVFGAYKQDLKLLSLAYYLIVNNDSSLCNYEEFAECTWLPYQLPLISSSISRMLRSITADQICRFQKRLDEEYRKQYGEKITEVRFWALDSTSITSYSENIASVEYGHNKDLMDAPQTNVLLIVDQTTGAPLHWRNFDGNVPDVSTIRNTLSCLTLQGVDLENVVLVTDRGYGSRANYDDMLRNGVGFVNNARLGSTSYLKDLVDQHYAELLDWNNEIPFIKQTAVTVPIDWYYDEFPVANKRSKKSAKKVVYAHIYYSAALQQQATENLKLRLTNFLKTYNEVPTNVKEESERIIRDFMDAQEDGTLRISMSKVDKRLRYTGIRVLMSDTVNDALECFHAYNDRNSVEYGFNTMKSRLSCNRTQTHSSENWDSKLFLQMLASSIGIMVRNRVKTYNESARNDKKLRVHYDSDHKLLAKLNNIYLTEFSNGWMFDEIAGKKKELFTVLGVEAPSVGQAVTTGSCEDETSSDDGYDLTEKLDDVEEL